MLTLSYETSSNISWICAGFSTWVETGWEELRESTSMASKHLSKKKSFWEKVSLLLVKCNVKYCSFLLFLCELLSLCAVHILRWRNKKRDFLAISDYSFTWSVLSSHHMQLWVGEVERNKLHELGKTLVEPQVIPPLHCHQVPKPLHGRTVFNSW